MSFELIHNKSKKLITIEFLTESLCQAIARLEFCSRLMHSLAPDEHGVWRDVSAPRVDAHIVGFPSSITWYRDSKLRLAGVYDEELTQQNIDDIHDAINGLKGIKVSEFGKTEYKFSIVLKSTNETFEYNFLGRSREIVALAVLWDMKPHSRDHLEVTRDSNLVYLVDFPHKFYGKPTKTYGDPSKIVDELRNQGFPRGTDQSKNGVYIDISRSHSLDTIQEHYQLKQRIQSLEDRVGRSQIPKKYKDLLYEESNFSCNNCGEYFPENYLAPDHRVPSIVQSDNLNSSNYLTVLQTLCVRCNQVKREACKKCPINHECERCSWAYPEKFAVSRSNLDLLAVEAEKENLTINEYLELLLN